MRSSVSRVRHEEGGQGLLEYALILLLVSIVVIGALTLIGVDIAGMFDPVFDAL